MPRKGHGAPPVAAKPVPRQEANWIGAPLIPGNIMKHYYILRKLAPAVFLMRIPMLISSNQVTSALFQRGPNAPQLRASG
jgi:hypothetical protein